MNKPFVVTLNDGKYKFTNDNGKLTFQHYENDSVFRIVFDIRRKRNY